jgi:hypothetical protein
MRPQHPYIPSRHVKLAQSGLFPYLCHGRNVACPESLAFLVIHPVSCHERGGTCLFRRRIDERCSEYKDESQLQINQRNHDVSLTIKWLMHHQPAKTITFAVTYFETYPFMTSHRSPRRLMCSFARHESAFSGRKQTLNSIEQR